MSWLMFDFLIWLTCFILQAALLGMVMYGLILCSDLENDFINPHDASKRINAWVLPEFGTQMLLTVLLAIGRKWLFGPLQLVVTLYNMRSWGRHEARTDVTEIFRQLPHVKRVRLVKLFFCLVCFIYCIFRLVQSSVHLTVGPGQQDEARELLKEAAASF